MCAFRLIVLFSLLIFGPVLATNENNTNLSPATTYTLTRIRPPNAAVLCAMQQPIDISCRPLGQTDRRTDGRTPDRCIDPTGAAKGKVPGGHTPPEIGFTRKFLAAPLS